MMEKKNPSRVTSLFKILKKKKTAAELSRVSRIWFRKHLIPPACTGYLDDFISTEH